MDRVQEILEAIAALPPADRQRLLRSLAEQSELPARPAQMPLLPSGPRPPDYVLVFDGGSKGNPGPGYGSYAITRTRDGARRLERIEFGDGYTSNEAEYDTLIAALRDLIGRIEGAGRQPRDYAVEVRGDSALVIYQLQGRWKVKEPRMRDRWEQASRLLQWFGAVELKTQPREESVRILGH